MFKIESHVKPPKMRKQRKCPPAVNLAFESYSKAYKLVYGVSPTGFTYDKATQFIHVGNSAGVSLMRLKELTRQLKLRAGA
jgi:hypothetical protein